MVIIVIYKYENSLNLFHPDFFFTTYRCICSNGESPPPPKKKKKKEKKKRKSFLSMSYDFLTSGIFFGLIGHEISHYLSRADKRVAVCIDFIKLC